VADAVRDSRDIDEWRFVPYRSNDPVRRFNRGYIPPEIKHEPEDLRPARRERQRQLLKSYHDLEREPYDFGRPGEEADIATGGR
jgi:hypothetical protein